MRRDFGVSDNGIFRVDLFYDIAERFVTISHKGSKLTLIIYTGIVRQSLRDIQTLLIGDLESVILREFRKHYLKACIEFGKLSLRDLASYLACRIYLDEDSEDLIIIRLNFIISHIVVRDARTDLADEDNSSESENHQHEF